MRKEYIPRLLTPCKLNQLKSLAEEYNLTDNLYDILLMAEYAYAHYSKVGNNGRYLQEVFELIYMLKYCGKKISFGAIMQVSNSNLGLVKTNKLQTESSDKRLLNKFLKVLEDSIDNETKDFYYNHSIIDYESDIPENEKYDAIIAAAGRKLRSGELSGEEYDKIVAKYIPLLKDEPERYDDFYSEENLGKVIRYQREESKRYPKHKQQLIGYYADLLLREYKYRVFGYTQYFIEVAEEPDRGLNPKTGEPQSDEEYYNSKEYQNFLAEMAAQENAAAEYDESSTAVLSRYSQYAFIYCVLWIVDIISTSVDENEVMTEKERFMYVRDCLRAYNKFRDRNEASK